MKESPAPEGFRKQITIGILLLNLVIIVLVGISVRQSRLQYEDRANVTTQNLTKVLVEYISGIINMTDVSLQSVADEAQRQLAGGGLKKKTINMYMLRQRERIPELADLMMTNAKGELVYGTGVVPGSLISVADRDYFIHLRNDSHGGIFISKPILSRVTGKWIIIIARRVEQPNGSFSGVVFGVIWLEDFAYKMFSKIDIGKHGSISLFDSELSVVCRYPAPQGIGKKFKSAELRELFKRKQPSATYRARATLDGVERTFSYCKISVYPLYVIVGLAKDDYLAEWRNNVAKVLGILAFFILITNIFVRLIYRHFTQRKKAEEALLYFQMAVDSSTDAIGMSTPEGRHYYQNEAYTKMFGLSVSEVDGVSGPPSTVYADEKDGAKIFDIIMNGGSFAGEVKMLDKDRNEKDIDLRAYSIKGKEDKVVGLVGMHTDITDRKRAEEKIIKSERQLLESQRVAHLGNWDLNLVFQELEWSNETYRLFDKSPEDFVPSFNEFGRLVHPDDRATMETNFFKALESDANPYHVAIRIKNDSGREWVMEAFGVVRRDPSGKALSIFGTAQDITERKKAEQQIKQSLKEKEILLKEIHHRVKNNLAVISSLLRLQALGANNESLSQALEESQQRIKSMALVHEHLYQARDFSCINYKDFINDIVKQLETIHLKRNRTIVTKLNIEDLTLDIDSAIPCSLIINELITNAYKYAFPDSRSGELSISFANKDDAYILAIKDNGIGLPEGFDYRKSNTLGLQIVNVLCKQLRGTLQMRSDRGTEAVITFKPAGNKYGKEKNTAS